jgi:hypothetical protein
MHYELFIVFQFRNDDRQSRSMRDNLIFKGIPDVYNPVEDTEGEVKDFIKAELGIEDEINFHVVHRLKPKQDRSPKKQK